MQAKWIRIALLCLGLCNGIEQTIVLGSLSLISDVFAVPDKIGWFSVSFTISMIVVSPVIGFYTNTKPLKPFFRFGLWCSIVGFLLCAWADQFSMLVMGRAIAGVGGGCLGVVSSAYIGRTFTLATRTNFDMVYLLLFTSGTFIGPILGSLFSAFFGWQSIFYISVLLFIGLYIVIEWTMPHEPSPPIKGKQKDGWFIVQSSSFSIFLFVMLLMIEWTHYAALFLGIGLFCFFVFLYATKQSKEQLFPAGLVYNRFFVILIAFSFIFGFTKFIFTNYLSIYATQVLSFDLLVANFCLTMLLLGNALGNIVITRVITRVAYKWLLLFAYVLEQVCFIGFIFLPINHSFVLYVLVGFVGFANGFAGYPILLILQSRYPDFTGSAAATNNMTRHFGGIMGVILFQHVIIQTQGVTLESFTNGFTLVWGMVALIGALVFFLPMEKLTKKNG